MAMRAGLRGLRLVCGSDRVFLAALAAFMRRTLPGAYAMLMAWMQKDGKVPAFPLMQDGGFISLMQQQLQPAVVSGSFHVPQWHIAALDTRCALGSFDVTWQRNDQGYCFECRGVYDWSPKDKTRPTAIIHQAAARLKNHAPMRWHFSIKHTGQLPASDWRPLDRLYL